MATVDSFVKDYTRAVRGAENKAGMQDADAELERIREDENRRSGPPADPRAQKVLRRLGRL